MGGKQKSISVTTSTPPKLSARDHDTKSKTVIENSNKAVIVSPEEKVHIPDNFDDSDADSETLSDKIRKLDGYGEIGQSSYKPEGFGDDQQILFVHDNSNDINMELLAQRQMMKQTQNQSVIQTASDIVGTELPSQNLDSDIAMEGVIASQESTITIVDGEEQRCHLKLGKRR